jgi:hypothetical protein
MPEHESLDVDPLGAKRYANSNSCAPSATKNASTP